MRIERYLRALVIAARMTLRGEQPPPRPHADLLDWSQQVSRLVDAVYAAAEVSRLGYVERQNLKLRLDGRLLSLETALATIQHHARREYPTLLRSGAPFNRAGVHAANFNHRYWVKQFQALPELQAAPALRTALERLSAHLDAIPPLEPAGSRVSVNES